MRASVLFIVLVGAALAACGLGVQGVPVIVTDEGGTLAPPGQERDGSTIADASGDVTTNDAAKDSAPPPCTTCSTSCPQACPACMGGDRYCIASTSCSQDCESCGTGSSYCNVCDADGTNPRRLCGSRSAGFCADGKYQHCSCATASDCGSREVCAGGVCKLCGESGSNAQQCQCGGTCTATDGDCHCG